MLKIVESCGEGTVQDQVGHPLRVARRVFNGASTPLGYPQKGKSIESYGIHHSFQVKRSGSKGQVFRFSVGQAGASLIESNQEVVFS